MKYICTLFVAVAAMAFGSVQAQTASKLNGQSYTYIMKDMNGKGPEIQDQFNFGVGKVSSVELEKSGFTSARVVEQNKGAASDFEITANSPSGTRVYRGRAEGTTIDGTIEFTDAKGVQTTMAFRGMLTEEWNHIQQERNGTSTQQRTPPSESQKKQEMKKSNQQ